MTCEAGKDEFLEILKLDAAGSRAEPGCLRFDFLEDTSKLNSYVFYEVYKDADALAFHKAQPHYQAYADFKDSGGVIKRGATVTKTLDFQD